MIKLGKYDYDYNLYKHILSSEISTTFSFSNIHLDFLKYFWLYYCFYSFQKNEAKTTKIRVKYNYKLYHFQHDS